QPEPERKKPLALKRVALSSLLGFFSLALLLFCMPSLYIFSLCLRHASLKPHADHLTVSTINRCAGSATTTLFASL
ncbi:hypothetical protein, partial [Enterovibrio norvegicus]|uniref:hypothetical protein n=1 Tax=Enterovibrio norvegicus TaxID=188144 RepID=UPI00352C9215